MKKINEIDLNALKRLCFLYNKNNIINDTEYGVWEIRGEDSNCDFSGPHSNPILGYAKGYFIDVLTYATTLNKFYTWGGEDILPDTIKRKLQIFL